MKTMKKTAPMAIATKGFKTKELRTWEQISAYQQRGWQITLTKEYLRQH